jgi:hypothetical protein
LPDREESTRPSVPVALGALVPLPELSSVPLPDREELTTLSVPAAPHVPFGIDRAALAQVVSGLECSRVNLEVDEGRRSISVSGHVRSAGDREWLVQKIAALGEIASLSLGNLHVVGEPYCRVLAFLDRPDLLRSEDQRHDAAMIGEPAQSAVLTLYAGMPLVLHLRGADFPSFLYVDYFTSDGRVYHLFPDRQSADARLAPRETTVIGGPTGRGLKATIGPPFGLDMVLALASEQPLLTSPRPTAEGAEGHLNALALAINAAKRRQPELRVEFTYFLIRTAAR